jgi:hypothetical protein
MGNCDRRNVVIGKVPYLLVRAARLARSRPCYCPGRCRPRLGRNTGATRTPDPRRPGGCGNNAPPCPTRTRSTWCARTRCRTVVGTRKGSVLYGQTVGEIWEIKQSRVGKQRVDGFGKRARPYLVVVPVHGHHRHDSVASLD